MNIHSVMLTASLPRAAGHQRRRAQARRHPARRHRCVRRARLLQRPGRRRRPRRRRRRRHRLPLLQEQGRPAHLDLRAQHARRARGGRAAVADLDDPARAAAPPRARAPRPARPRSEPRDRLPGRAAPVDQVHGALLLDALARLPRPDPRGDRRRPGRAGVPRRHQADAAAKMFFGALDEMATNWILSRRRYSLEADAERSSTLFLNGARTR